MKYLKLPAKEKNRVDLSILILPLERKTVYHGPALIKSFLQKSGYKVNYHDVNSDCYNFFKKKYNIDNVSEIFNYNNVDMLNEWRKEIDSFVVKWMQIIKSENPRVLGISCFSFRDSSILTNIFTENIRKCFHRKYKKMFSRFTNCSGRARDILCYQY